MTTPGLKLGTNDPFPNSRRIYLGGETHPKIRVPMREVILSPTKRANGLSESNDPVRIYDCSGPWGDPQSMATPHKACPLFDALGLSSAATRRRSKIPRTGDTNLRTDDH